MAISGPKTFLGDWVSLAPDPFLVCGGGLCWGVGTHPRDTMGYGQQAGGTHPTGMLSCLCLPLLIAPSQGHSLW